MGDPAVLRVFLRRMRALALLIAVVLVAGTVGLVVAEDVSPWRGFLWSVDTIATVGSMRPPESLAGQLVRLALIVLGVGTLFYALVTSTELFVAGHLAELLAHRRTQKLIDATSDHIIVCGLGRVGRQVAHDLRAAGATFVIIDRDPAVREHAGEVGGRFIAGEAADEDVLREAGIERARGVISCVDSDSDNVFITLTVRGLRPDLPIVARASAESAEAKLRRAGATRVISPYKSSGAEMARVALNPQSLGALDVGPHLRVEEIEVAAGSAGAGRPVGEVGGGAMIVGVRDTSGRFHAQPSPDTLLAPGDVVTAMGSEPALEAVAARFVPDGAARR